MGPTARHHRARVASLTRDRLPNDPELLAERQALALTRVEERIAAAVDAAPPLPGEVVDRLCRIIRSAEARPIPPTPAGPQLRPRRVAEPADSGRLSGPQGHERPELVPQATGEAA